MKYKINYNVQRDHIDSITIIQKNGTEYTIKEFSNGLDNWLNIEKNKFNINLSILDKTKITIY